MKLASFNVNGIRAREHQLQALVERHEPDVIGIQETKVQDAEFPESMVGELGYYPYYHGQKGHFGVALLSRTPLDNIQRGLPGDDDDSQRRLITGTLTLNGQALTVINGYFPNGEQRDHPTKFPAKERFYAALRAWLDEQYHPDERLAVMGDFNISPEDTDIGIGEDNRKRWLREGKCSFLPEEREWFATLLEWGLSDSFRVCHPHEDARFSWFDYRSRGFERDPKRGLRIDGILASEGLKPALRESWIDYDIRAMAKPSDHCPIWAEFT